MTSSRVVGLDLWQTKDQSGNSEAATRRSADVEGLTDRIDLVTGDMRALPFDDASFDPVGGRRDRGVADVGVVPFAQTEAGGVVVGFWPGRGRPAPVPVRVLTPVE